jgi:hypothetical protein
MLTKKKKLKEMRKKERRKYELKPLEALLKVIFL